MSTPVDNDSKVDSIIARESPRIPIIIKKKEDNIAINDDMKSEISQIMMPNEESHIKNNTLNIGIRLLSYLEKSKIKEDMRRLITGKIMQLRTFIELDYFDHRLKVKDIINECHISEDDLSVNRGRNMKLDIECVAVGMLHSLLINIRTCDMEFPDLALLKKTCVDYSSYLSRMEPNIYFAGEEVMKRAQDKVSLCNSVIYMCSVYSKNVIWKEFLEGNWENAGRFN